MHDKQQVIISKSYLKAEKTDYSQIEYDMHAVYHKFITYKLKKALLCDPLCPVFTYDS